MGVSPNITAICLFCGSSRGNRAEFVDAAKEIGTLIAQAGVTLVYGGGQTGLMGAAANAALNAGGKVIGIIPEALALHEVAHSGLTELRIVESMHTRKAMMEELSDAFIALPGGLGTFEELLEMLTWAQLGIHHKPVGLLNVGGFFNPMLAMLDSATEAGFIRAGHRDLLWVEQDAARLIERIRTELPAVPDDVLKWLDRGAI